MGEAMAYRPKFGSKHRDYLYSAARTDAHLLGRGEHPICPLCDLPVTPDQAWDEVHITVPRCFGGKSKTVGHRDCNQLENNKVVTPAFAKAERVRKRHVGITGPGLGKHPMRCGRRSKLRKTMQNGVQPRLTYAERHARFLRDRYFVEVEDFSEPLEVQP
jgi:hypothetical protein